MPVEVSFINATSFYCSSLFALHDMIRTWNKTNDQMPSDFDPGSPSSASFLLVVSHVD